MANRLVPAELTIEEVYILKSYTGMNYIAINNELRKGILSEDARTLSQIFEKSPTLGDQMIVYRGVNQFSQLFEDDTFFFYGITSTSLRFEIADNFCNKVILPKKKGTKCSGPRSLFILTLPKSTKAIYLESISLYPEEEEIILPHLSMFKVTHTKEKGQTTYVYAVLIDQLDFLRNL